MGRDMFHQTRMLRAPSHQDLSISRDGTATFFGVFFVLQNWKAKGLVDAQLQTGLHTHLWASGISKLSKFKLGSRDLAAACGMITSITKVQSSSLGYFKAGKWKSPLR